MQLDGYLDINLALGGFRFGGKVQTADGYDSYACKSVREFR